MDDDARVVRFNHRGRGALLKGFNAGYRQQFQVCAALLPGEIGSCGAAMGCPLVWFLRRRLLRLR